MQHKLKWVISIFVLSGVGWIYFSNSYLVFLPLILSKKVVDIWEYVEMRQLSLRRLEQFQLFLDAAASFMNSGNSLERTCYLSCNQICQIHGDDLPVVKHLTTAEMQFKNGTPTIQVISDLFKSFEIHEAIVSAEAVKLLTVKGGNIGNYFAQLSGIIHEKFETNKEIQIVRTQKQNEALLVCFLPILFFLFLKLSSPDFVEPLYTSRGHFIMGGSFFLWIISATFIYKTLIQRLE